METNLILVKKENGKSVISARELYDFLEIKTQFKDWFPRMVEYGFEDGLDFSSILSESTGGRPSVDYAITMDMAKELSMLQRTEKGKQARQYFIACEKQLANNKPSLPATYAEALRQLATEVEEKERISLQLEAKTEQLDESKEWITIKRFAKENGLNWRNISWRALKALSIEHGYEVKKVFDANYGEVNIYHKNVFAIWNKSKPKYLK